MRSLTAPIALLASITLASCGGNSPDEPQGGPKLAAEDRTEVEAGSPDPAVVGQAKLAGNDAKQVAESNNVAGAMTATIAGEKKVFYIAGDSNLIEWNEADDGSTRVEMIGSPLADDWQWQDSMELTFNVSNSTVTNPQLIFRSMGSSDFHRTTSGQIVVSKLATEGEKLTVAGSFSGTLRYQSFSDKSLEGYPQEFAIDDGAFYASFAN